MEKQVTSDKKGKTLKEYMVPSQSWNYRNKTYRAFFGSSKITFCFCDTIHLIWRKILIET